MPKNKRPAPLFLQTKQGAAGVDVGAGKHFVCVGPDPATAVREFATFSADLDFLADWLFERGVGSVAMEATGVYWIPLWEVLSDRRLEVYLVATRQTHRSGRRKTDLLDWQWLRRLHAAGLFSPSFLQDQQIRCIALSVSPAGGDGRRGALHPTDAEGATVMNVKLTQVVGAATGKTGMAIMRAILAGERDPAKPAALRNRRCSNDEATINPAADTSCGNRSQDFESGFKL